jgi:hypothetical protein
MYGHVQLRVRACAVACADAYVLRVVEAQLLLNASEVVNWLWTSFIFIFMLVRQELSVSDTKD